MQKKNKKGQFGGTDLLFVAHRVKYTKRLYIRHSPGQKNGPGPVVFCVTIARQKFRLTTPISLKASEFDLKKGLVKIPSQPDKSHTYTRILQSYLAKAENIFTRAMLLDKPLTLTSFKQQWQAFENRANFIEFFEQEIKALKASRTAGTIKVYNVVKTRLEQFKPGLLFSEIDSDFIERYDRYLIGTKINSNTRMKHHKTLKTFCNIALSRDFIFADPYKKLKIKRIKSERSHISKESLLKLADLFASKSLAATKQAVLRVFLFSCYTGVRFSDCKTLSDQNLIGETLVFSPQKTQAENIVVKMKLPDCALELINKKGLLLPTVSEAKTNKELKYIANFLELKETLTFHTARHTFATMFILSGGGVETLQLLLGHSKIETTMIYVQLVNEKAAQEKQMLSFAAFLKK